ncbi:MAG: DUF945 family protein [Lautropia sp.]|nr:DUF945 family protein [Lautropia sp.]
MNRKLGLSAAVCIALGGAYATTSWWLGQQIQEEYRAKLDSALALLGHDKAVSIVSRSYERDLFSARATLVLQFREPARPAPEPAAWHDASLLNSLGEDEEEADEVDDDAPLAFTADDGTSGSETGSADGSEDEPQISEETLSTLLGEGTDPEGSSDGTGEAAAPKPARTIRVHLAQELRHGPWTGGKLAAAAIETKIVRVEGLDEAVYKTFAGARTPTLTTIHGFDRALSGQFRLPAGEMKDPSDQNARNRIHWETLSYDFELDGNRTRWRGQASWPLLAANVAETGKPGGMTMTMNGWQARHEQQLDAGQWLMPPGSYQGTLSRLAMTFEHPTPSTPKLDVLLSDLRFDSQARQADGLIAAKQQVNGKGQVGPLKFDDLSIEAEFQRLDARVLAELQQLIIAVFNASANDDAAPTAPDFEQLTNRLLAAAPEIREQFKLTVGGETASLGYGVKVDPSIKASMDEAPGLASWADRLKVNASVSIPRSLVKTIADLVDHPEMKAESMMLIADMMAAQGYLKSTGSAWQAEAEMKRGSISVNGMNVLDNYGLGLLGGSAMPVEPVRDESLTEGE